jgi:pantothenate kinase
VVVGIVGEPGAGKSTLAAALVGALDDAGVLAVGVPMDGYHLTNAELARRGLADRKGARETFDADAFADLLARIRSDEHGEVRAAAYDRAVEERVVDAIVVAPEVPVVVTEGNYLLVDEGPWRRVRGLLDEAWYVETDPSIRLTRLVARHEEFGKSPERARDWVATVDEPNAALIRSTRQRADLVVRLT